MAEGLADLALHAAVGPDWGPWAAEIYADLGLRFDAERAVAVAEATAALADVRQDAALMLHDEHRDETEVAAFLRRWLLVDDTRARQMLRFVSSRCGGPTPPPTWRATGCCGPGWTTARRRSASPNGSPGCSTSR